MAVQAQYPSSLLFHDRGEPERRKGMDMPKPHQLAGVSPDVYFASGGASGGNRRKRSREAMAMAPPLPVKEEYINLFALQPQHQQSAQFYNRVASSASPSPSPATRVSTGLRLALDEQQQRHINSLCYASTPSPFANSLSDEFAGQMKQHGEELDRFIRDQGEQLRRAIADRVRHHNRALLAASDKSASRRLREKAVEAEREARRGAELEDRLARLRAEAAAWQAKALSEQATAVALHAQLQQASAAARASCEEVADGGVLVVGVRGPSPRRVVPRVPSRNGHGGAPPLQTPEPVRRLLRRRRRGRLPGVSRVPLRQDRQRGGHSLLSWPARPSREVCILRHSLFQRMEHRPKYWSLRFFFKFLFIFFNLFLLPANYPRRVI